MDKTNQWLWLVDHDLITDPDPDVEIICRQLKRAGKKAREAAMYGLGDLIHAKREGRAVSEEVTAEHRRRVAEAEEELQGLLDRLEYVGGLRPDVRAGVDGPWNWSPKWICA